MGETKIGIVADIHGNHLALRAVFEVLKGRVDHYLFLGDLGGYYPFVRECLAMWPTASIVGVRGNHDQVMIDVAAGLPAPRDYRRKYGSGLERSLRQLSGDDVERIRQLPTELAITVEGTRLALFHGGPWDPLNARVYPDFEAWERFGAVGADVILLGHTHYPLARCVGSQWIINPGSVGQPRDRRGACWAELSVPSCRVSLERVDYDPGLIVDDAKLHDPEVGYLVEVLTR